MTNVDQLLIAAIDAGVPFKSNGREVFVWLDRITVRLHGKDIASVLFDKGELVLAGDIPVSRKSAKVLNALLTHYTSCSILSRKGEWNLRLKNGCVIPTGGRNLSIPMTYKKTTSNN